MLILFSQQSIVHADQAYSAGVHYEKGGVQPNIRKMSIHADEECIKLAHANLNALPGAAWLVYDDDE